MTSKRMQTFERFIDSLSDEEVARLLKRLLGHTRIGPFDPKQYAEISTLVIPPERERTPEEIAILERHTAALAALADARAGFELAIRNLQRAEKARAPVEAADGYRRRTREQAAEVERLSDIAADAKEALDQAAAAEVAARPGHRRQRPPLDLFGRVVGS